MNRRKNPRYKLILNMPDLVARHKKIGSSLFTVAFWALFVYLWMPLITLVAWTFGLYQTYSEVQYAQEVLNFKHLLFLYSMIVLILGGALLVWALQQYLRFRHATRRLVPTSVKPTELARYTNLDEHHIAKWQMIRRMVAHHDEHGSVTHFAPG